MQTWKRDDAMLAVATLGLHGHNREVADYWLSLWNGDRPPTRASFDPKKLATRIPALAIIEMRPDESIRCRLVGSYGRLMYGHDLTGKDLLAATPPAQRMQRIENVKALLHGQVIAMREPLRREDGSKLTIQNICLPFADQAEDGSHRYLVHTNWQPTGADWFLPRGPRCDIGIAEDQIALPIG